MKLVVLGSPGVGKGTYTGEMIKTLKIPQISTGDIFRKNIKEETELGRKVKSCLDEGKLVPDELVVEVVKDRLTWDDCANGFILDGFPRTICQAEALAEITELDFALNFVADSEVIIERLGGRRICKACKAIFHMKNVPPKFEGVCDYCGGELYTRPDDNPETIKERLRLYEEETAPLVGFYQEKGILKEVKVNEDFGSYKNVLMKRIFDAIEVEQNPKE
jgi:adenylate kinase